MNKNVLRWNFVFQYGWVLTNVINSILLFPIYINHIDKDTLGMWVATSSILNFMTLADPGIGEVLQQKIAELRGKKQNGSPKNISENIITDDLHEHSEIGLSIGSGFIASAIILFLSIVVGVICFFCVGTLINKNIDHYPNLSVALLITIISTGMQLVSFTVSGINQGMHNSAHVAISSLTANFVFLIVNLFFLYMGLGVISIALANLIRALYINIFNFTSLLSLLKREGTKIKYQAEHFKKFIRIFSFTSASKIISTIGGGIDMLVLGRFIAPAQITLYELNKRPINQSNSLIGRHSVALMPLISHAKGLGDKPFIINFIHKQFKLYVYVLLFASFLFVLNYKDLLILWTGPGTFLGYPVLLLMIISSFTGLTGYFMSNMGYALGDIKANSKYYMIKNLLYAVLVFFAASRFGIMGTLVVSLTLSALGEFTWFGYRNYKMGYIDSTRMKQSIITWVFTIAVSILVCWVCLYFINHIVPAGNHLSKMLLGSVLFSSFFIIYVLITDKEMLAMLLELRNKLSYHPLLKRKQPQPAAKNITETATLAPQHQQLVND